MPPSASPKTVVFVESVAAMAGVQFTTLRLVQRLDRSRWNPVVICSEEGDLPRACRLAGARVEIVSRPRMFSTSFWIGTGRRLPNPAAWVWDGAAIWMAARRLARHLVRERPDLVVTKGMHSHFYGGLAARRLGVPCMWQLQDLVSDRLCGLYRLALGEAARGLAAGLAATGAHLPRQLPPEVQERTRVVLNGVDTLEFRPSVDGSGVRRELGIPSEALVIGNLARLTPWKGQHCLLEAFARIASEAPRARLLFAGGALFESDAYERRLRSRAEALGLADRVTFAGHRPDPPRVLAAMDIFAYPVIEEKDSSPLALLEAMASGLPVVAFDTEGIREVVGAPEQGLLVPAGEIESFAGALLAVLDDKSLRRHLGSNARRRIEEAFSLERYIHAMEEAFFETLHRATAHRVPGSGFAGREAAPSAQQQTDSPGLERRVVEEVRHG